MNRFLPPTPRGCRSAPSCPRLRAAFTLLELMLAIAIFAGVLAAIYSSWTAILRSSQVGLAAAAEAQRSRVAFQAIEEALVGAQLFTDNLRYYSFLVDTAEETPYLSFVARLPRSFPRSGKFGDQVVRRVSFSAERDRSGQFALVLRQTPLLFEPDVDEEENPLVLARDVQLFTLEFWGPSSREWETAWPHTNQLPRLVRFSLALGAPSRMHASPDHVVTRVVTIPGGLEGRGVPVTASAPPASGTNLPPPGTVPGPDGGRPRRAPAPRGPGSGVE